MQAKPGIGSICLMVMLFASVTFFVGTGRTAPFDAAIEGLLSDINQTSSAGVIICKGLSMAGKWYVYAAVSGILFLLPATRYSMGLPVGLTLGGALVLNKLLKALMMIERPDFPLARVGGYSFPSGHAMYGTAFIGVLVCLVSMNIRSPRRKAAVKFFSVLLMLVVGFSRVYLRAHYTSDVIGGYIAGLILVMVFLCIYHRRKENDGLFL